MSSVEQGKKSHLRDGDHRPETPMPHDEQAAVTPPRPNPAPAGFQVRYRSGRGRPWAVLAVAPTRDDAAARMFELMASRRGGDWHVAAAPAGR